MTELRLTEHARARMQQRAIPPAVLAGLTFMGALAQFLRYEVAISGDGFPDAELCVVLDRWTGETRPCTDEACPATSVGVPNHSGQRRQTGKKPSGCRAGRRIASRKSWPSSAPGAWTRRAGWRSTTRPSSFLGTAPTWSYATAASDLPMIRRSNLQDDWP